MKVQLQLTLALLKPEAVVRPDIVKAIRVAIATNGFNVLRKKELKLSREAVAEFYSQHAGRFFYERLVTHMSSGPIVALVLVRDAAITKWRSMIGPTKVFRAIHTHPGSLRARYALTDTRNALHGSGHYIVDVRF